MLPLRGERDLSPQRPSSGKLDFYSHAESPLKNKLFVVCHAVQFAFDLYALSWWGEPDFSPVYSLGNTAQKPDGGNNNEPSIRKGSMFHLDVN